MREIGILNLTRFGDLVQTTPLLLGLRKRHADARIHLIVKRRFATVARLLPCVDVVHELDGDVLARAVSEPAASLVDAYRSVEELVAGIEDVQFDLLFNLTHSRSSAVLLSLLDARQPVGFTVDRTGQRRVASPWLQHIGTVVRARRVLRFNLVDVYLGAAGLLGSGEPLAFQVPQTAKKFASDQLPAHVTHRIAVQLGASQDSKTWALQSYGETLDRLAARLGPGLEVVLVGVPDEAERADELVRAHPNVAFRNLVGATQIDELAAVLERCALLLTGDTGTMHLAAAVGTRTCAVFVGLGNPHETGAYAADHWALRSRIDCAPCSHLVHCGNPVCQHDFPPEWVAELIERLLTGGDPTALPPLPRAELLRSRFDELGMLEYAPVQVRPPTADDLLAPAYRAVFVESFTGVEVPPHYAWRRAELHHGKAPADWDSVLPDDVVPGLEAMAELGRTAARSALSLEGLDPKTARDAGEALREVDAAIRAHARAQPLLAPLALALESGLESLEDADLSTASVAGAGHYNTLTSRARRLAQIARGETA